MHNPPDWKYPTNPRSRHASAELTRRSARQERVLSEIEGWRSTARSRTHAPERARRLSGLLRGIVLLVLLLGVAVAATAVLVARAYEGRIYPSVVAGDVPVGSLTPDEATEKLEARLGPYLDEPVALRLGQNLWQPSAADLGLAVDVPETIRRAMEAGRRTSLLVATVDTLLGRSRPVTVPFVMTLDDEQLDMYLADIEQQVNQDPSDPRVIVRGAEVSVEAGGEGYNFLRDETELRLRGALARLSSGPVPVQVYTSAGALDEQSVDRAAEQARKVVSGPVVLEAEGRRWEIPPKQLGDWIRTESREAEEGRAQAVISLDPVELRSYLSGLARELDRPARDVRLQWAGGAVQVLRGSEAGRQLNVDAAIGAVTQAALGDNRIVQLPVQPVNPKVTEASISSLGIRELLGVGETSYTTAPREHAVNVQLAGEAITGYVVPPGGEFSFADAIGRVSEEEGYRLELVGDGERGLQGQWTGISQVSTATYRAAFSSGLPISERHAPPHLVPWLIEGEQLAGLDAVVTLPGEDLKFANDTGAAVLVQVVQGSGEMRVELYGTKGGRVVDVEQPVVSNVVQPVGDLFWEDPDTPRGQERLYAYAQPGMEVEMRRTIRRPGQTPDLDTEYTKYAPLPSVFIRGTR